jgi:PEP-CTERM motif
VFITIFIVANARYIAGVTPVPEPSATMALFGIAALGLFKTRRRRSASVVKVDSGL